jgi:hypothetical protein
MGGPKSNRLHNFRIALIILVGEKIIQHALVTIAFYFNWMDIRLTVAVPADILMILGAVVTVLYTLCFWAIMTQKRWSNVLLMGLALFDIVGEFIAQGRLDITINVSILVAFSLLILALFYRKQESSLLGPHIEKS